jgi:hypothetical protein
MDSSYLGEVGPGFLDEIAELPLELQVKLLRVLKEGQLERLGSTKTLTVDVRLIAATNRDLAARVATDGSTLRVMVGTAPAGRAAAPTLAATERAQIVPPWSRPAGASVARVAPPRCSASTPPLGSSGRRPHGCRGTVHDRDNIYSP